MMTQMYIRGIQVSSGDDLPLIILETMDGKLKLEVPAGPFEASAVMLELEGIKPTQPLVHDFFADFFRFHGFKLDRVEIFAASERLCRARIVYRKGMRSFEREASPPDAFALALRLSAPVLVHDGAKRILSGEPPQAEYANLKLVKPARKSAG